MRRLLLLLCLTLTTVRVAGSADLGDVANDALDDCSDSGNEKNHANPVVPYIRCEHATQRSQRGETDRYLVANFVSRAELWPYGRVMALLAGVGVAHDLITKAISEAVEKAVGEFIVLRLGFDDGAQFSMELIGALAVGAPFEVTDDFGNPFLGQLGVKERFKFSKCFFTVSHCSFSVWGWGARVRPMGSREGSRR